MTLRSMGGLGVTLRTVPSRGKHVPTKVQSNRNFAVDGSCRLGSQRRWQSEHTCWRQQVREALEYSADLVASEDDGQPLRSLRAHNVVQPRDLDVHQLVIEEEESAQRLILAGGHQLSSTSQTSLPLIPCPARCPRPRGANQTRRRMSGAAPWRRGRPCWHGRSAAGDPCRSAPLPGNTSA